MKVPRLEKELGIEVYATKSLGIGGRIRQFPEEFVVEEILLDGSKASTSSVEPQPVVGKGPYLICVLVKQGWDTLLSIKELAKRLGMSHKRIQIAGIKDAKALTAQHVSLKGVAPEQIQQVRIKDITLYPLRFCDEAVFSHLLLGNQFHITIRAIAHTTSTVEKRVERVQSELSNLGGFPNFFGHQRFGTIRPITHQVGRYLVKGDPEKAALTFLAQPSPHEHPESMLARQQLIETLDFEEAARSFPKHLRYERWMLSHLAKHPRDFVGAFRRLPRKLRKLFIHAYQSFLFNKFLSQRIQRGILLNEARSGDYALYPEKNRLPSTRFTKVTDQSIEKVEKAIKEGRMQIAIPLIGYKQPPSAGIQGEIEREILEKEGVSPRDFRISSIPEARAPGRLRTTLATMNHLSIKKTSSDLENSSKRKVKLSFTLHRGSYATILLRELMKPRDLIKAGF